MGDRLAVGVGAVASNEPGMCIRAVINTSAVTAITNQYPPQPLSLPLLQTSCTPKLSFWP